MQTLKQIVSDIANDLKAHNLDDRYSFRYLANKFKDKIAYFLRIEARSREFVKALGLWQSINCVELEDIPVTTCGDIGDCYKLKRSTIQIPDVYETNYGLMLKVTTIDGRKEFAQLKNSTQYNDYVTREYKTNKLPFFIEDKYIFIPNTDIDAVKVLLVPKDTITVKKLNDECDVCTSPLEGEIPYTQYLISLAKKEVLTELGALKNIVEDEKGNDNTNEK